MELTEQSITNVLNQAADDIANAAELADTGSRDALNLLVNVVARRLFTDPDATVDEVILAGYDAPPDEVLGWLSE